MASISFDPVAHAYDATRGYPEEVARQIGEQIDKAANGNGQTRFLEVGVGTGRIAFPIAKSGRNYTGIDISEKMLSVLEGKLRAAGWQKESLEWGSLPDEDAARKLEVRRFVQAEGQGAMRLLVSDMTDVPFHDASFDAVIAVHVFHLVSEWQSALQEVLHLLRPGGVLLRCWDEGGRSGPLDIRREWRRIVRELGGSTERPGGTEQVVTAWLQERGLQTEKLTVLTWEQIETPRAHFQSIAQRLWSSTWSVPDDIFAASVERLQQWVDENYGATIDDQYKQERHFVIERTKA